MDGVITQPKLGLRPHPLPTHSTNQAKITASLPFHGLAYALALDNCEIMICEWELIYLKYNVASYTLSLDTVDIFSTKRVQIEPLILLLNKMLILICDLLCYIFFNLIATVWNATHINKLYLLLKHYLLLVEKSLCQHKSLKTPQLSANSLIWSPRRFL